MGLGIDDLRFILSAQSLGFSGKRICTLGRQTFYGGQSEINRVLKDYGKPVVTLPPNRPQHFAEDVLEQLDFDTVSLDFSDYEDAKILHDMNCPIPDSLQEQFDLVIDGGTLEHVFNYPIALENAMRMIRIGGHIMLITPANNQCGHGFYQFSPELFFRIFSPANGFELLRMYVTGRGGPYHIADPIKVHGRVTLRNQEHSFLMVHARKTANAPLSTPQQSDYVVDWCKGPEDGPKQDSRVKRLVRRVLSAGKLTFVGYMLNKLRFRQSFMQWKRVSKFSNRRFYVPVTDWTVPTKDVFPDL